MHPPLAGQKIGQSQPPLPYLSPQLTGQRLLVGANFASAGIGILNDTGVQFVSQQFAAEMKNHTVYCKSSFLNLK